MDYSLNLAGPAMGGLCPGCDMSVLLGMITTAGGLVVAVTAVLAFIGLMWRGTRKVYRAGVWIHAWALRNEALTGQVQALGQRIERVIGTNGGSTLFDRLASLEDGQERIASMAYALREPSLLFDAKGQVMDINPAFSRLTGWSENDLERGGWRAKFPDDQRDDWDEAIRSQGVFEGTVQLRGMSRPIDMHIRPIGKDGRFLGWRGVFTPIT